MKWREWENAADDDVLRGFGSEQGSASENDRSSPVLISSDRSRKRSSNVQMSAVKPTGESGIDILLMERQSAGVRL
jgi:hypothetical protein